MSANISELHALHALRLSNAARVMRMHVPDESKSHFDQLVDMLDRSIEGLFAIDHDVAAAITMHLLDEHGIVVKKAAVDALASISKESQFVATMADALANGYPITSAERRRLNRSIAQIKAALEIARA